MPSLFLTTPEEFKELYEAIYPNKAVCFENIPPNIVKLATETFARLALHDINNSILNGVFPSEAKSPVVYLLIKEV